MSMKRKTLKKRGETFSSAKVAPYVFVLPFLLTFVIFFIYPIISSVMTSFQNVQLGASKWVGLANYKRLAASSEFPTAIRNSLLYTVITIALMIPFPLLFAVMLNSKSMRGGTFFRAVLFMPILCSVVVAGMTFRFMFNETDSALVNEFFMKVFGTRRIMWKSRQWPAMAMMVSLCCWRWTGMNIVYFMSGLRSVPVELYEAADIDGASAAQRFWNVTVPSVKPTTIYVLTISIYGGLSMYTESRMLWDAKSSPMNVGLTIVGFVYQKGISQADYGFASCAGLCLLLVTLVVNFIQLRGTGAIGKGGAK